MRQVKKQFIQVSKAARVLDCSNEFVFTLIRDKKLTAINLGQRMTRVSVESLDHFIAQNRLDPDKFFSAE
jgi:excisionase family DNA binding protein